MQHQTEEGDPLLKLRCSIVTHLNTGVGLYTMTMQQIKRLCIFGPKGAIQIRYYYYY